MLTAYITTAGQAAIVGAQFGGYQISLTAYKVSSSLITETEVSTIRAYTELPGTIVYDSGNNPTDGSIKYEVVNTTDVTITTYLSADIGPFTIGAVGLYLADGTLFAVLKLDQTYSKTANGTGVSGNTFSFPLLTTLTLLESLDVTVLPESAATLPQVATDVDLPAYNLAPHGNYFVQSFGGTGKSAIACRASDSWQFCLSSNADLYDGWIKVDSSSFGSSVVEGNVVYFNYSTNKWENLDSSTADVKLVGIKCGTGVRTSSFYYKENAFVANTDYFCNTAPNQGGLTTLSTPYFIGTALSSNILHVNPKKIGDDIFVPQLPRIFSATVVGDAWKLTLPTSEVYPEAYENGMSVKFLAPANNIANQKIFVGGLGEVYITKLPPSSPSPTQLEAGEITTYNLVEATFISSDQVSGGFRLGGTALAEGKVSKIGDTMTGILTVPQVTLQNTPSSSSDATTKDYVDNLWFIGDEKRSYQNSNHGKWLLCNGQAVSRSTYSALFALMGTTHGVGDGVTTFNLYDSRGRVSGSIGQGVGLTNRENGDMVGNETHSLTSAENGPHTHSITCQDESTTPNGNYVAYGDNPAPGTALRYTNSSGNGDPHNIMQPTIFAGNTFIYAGV